MSGRLNRPFDVNVICKFEVSSFKKICPKSAAHDVMQDRWLDVVDVVVVVVVVVVQSSSLRW